MAGHRGQEGGPAQPTHMPQPGGASLLPATSTLHLGGPQAQLCQQGSPAISGLHCCFSGLKPEARGVPRLEMGRGCGGGSRRARSAPRWETGALVCAWGSSGPGEEAALSLCYQYVSHYSPAPRAELGGALQRWSVHRSSTRGARGVILARVLKGRKLLERWKVSRVLWGASGLLLGGGGTRGQAPWPQACRGMESPGSQSQPCCPAAREAG